MQVEFIGHKFVILLPLLSLTFPLNDLYQIDVIFEFYDIRMLILVLIPKIFLFFFIDASGWPLFNEYLVYFYEIAIQSIFIS